MELGSLVAGIIELFSRCRDCYSFYKKPRNTDIETRLMIEEFDVEASILHSWGCYWGIHPPGSPDTSRLQDYLRQSPHKQSVVVKILLQIGELMTNDGWLSKNCGVKLTLRDDQGQGREPKFSDFRIRSKDEIDKIDTNKTAMKDRMNLLKKCKWTILRGKDGFSNLLKTLHQYNTSLRHCCPEGAGKDLNRFLVTSFLDDHDESNLLDEATKRMDQLAQKEKDPSIKEGLKFLRDMVEIKGTTGFHKTKQVTDDQKRILLRYRPAMLFLNRSEDLSTLAVLTKDHKRSVVYVEFKSYEDDVRTKTHDREDFIFKFGRLMVDSKYGSSRLNTMKCIGLFKDGEKKRIGFIFKLAKPLQKEGITWNDYEPCRLSNILNHRRPQFDLGWRLSLAKEVVDNIIRLHAVGGLHKNIRSDSVLFCPKGSPTSARIDYSKHSLMAYGLVRLEANPTSNQGHAGKCPDIYHHPDMRKSPDQKYQYAYDIYSLGILLLEIGLWQSLPQIVKERQNDDFVCLQKYILRKVESELPSACGNIYFSVVKTFLKIESGNDPVSMKTSRDKCLKMARRLSRCVV